MSRHGTLARSLVDGDLLFLLFLARRWPLFANWNHICLRQTIVRQPAHWLAGVLPTSNSLSYSPIKRPPDCRSGVSAAAGHSWQRKKRGAHVFLFAGIGPMQLSDREAASSWPSAPTTHTLYCTLHAARCTRRVKNTVTCSRRAAQKFIILFLAQSAHCAPHTVRGSERKARGTGQPADLWLCSANCKLQTGNCRPPTHAILPPFLPILRPKTCPIEPLNSAQFAGRPHQLGPAQIRLSSRVE